MKKVFPIFIFFLLTVLLILGGLGERVADIEKVAVPFGALTLTLTWYKEKKIEFPKGIIVYSIFLMFFWFHSLSLSVNSQKSLEYFNLFLSSGIFWLVFYNFRKEKLIRIDRIIILLGIIFGALAFYTRYLGLETIKNWSLYTWSSGYRNHNHIGDLWALVLLVAFYHLLKNPKKIILWPLIPLGFYFLLISQSRAAILSLGVGTLYLSVKRVWIERYKSFFIFLYTALAAIFLYFGSQKSIIFSHPYYIQAVLGFIHNPQGVGIGNFGVISSNPQNHILGLSGFSYFTHDLVLEVLVGLGVLGFSFIYWLWKVILELIRVESGIRLLYSTLFIALLTNFLFDVTYTVPTMVWLWFMLLGLAQTPQEASEVSNN